MNTDELMKVYDNINIDGEAQERILNNINNSYSKNSSKVHKKHKRWIILAASLAALISMTVYAAYNNFELFQRFFGKSINVIKDHINVSEILRETTNYDIKVVGTYFSNNRADIIISISGKTKLGENNLNAIKPIFRSKFKPKDISEYDSYSGLSSDFEINYPEDTRSRYFIITYSSDNNIGDNKLELTIILDGENINIDIPTESSMQSVNNTFQLNLDDGSILEQYDLSPLSLSVKGYFSDITELPDTPQSLDIKLVFEDGSEKSINDIQNSYVSSIDKQTGILSYLWEFKEIINIEKVKHISINRYFLNN